MYKKKDIVSSAPPPGSEPINVLNAFECMLI